LSPPISMNAMVASWMAEDSWTMLSFMELAPPVDMVVRARVVAFSTGLPRTMSTAKFIKVSRK